MGTRNKKILGRKRENQRKEQQRQRYKNESAVQDVVMGNGLVTMVVGNNRGQGIIQPAVLRCPQVEWKVWRGEES